MKFSRKRIGILLFLALLAWRAWPLIPIFLGFNTKVPTDKNLIDELLPPSEEPAAILNGLSHQHWNPYSLTKEILFGRRNISHGHAFNPDRIEILSEHRRIASILSNRSSYLKWGGEKGCGGFHGDFLITWRNGDTKWEAIICTGCNEVILHHKDQAVRCDLAYLTGRQISAFYSRTINRPPFGGESSFRRLLISIELLSESNTITEDPKLLVRELSPRDTIKFIKLIKSHSPDSSKNEAQVSDLLQKHLLECFTHLSVAEKFPHSLVSLITDPELSWSPSELSLLHNAIVGYGRRAIQALKNAPQDNEDIQHCLKIVRASKD